jgi:hypothetical protein
MDTPPERTLLAGGYRNAVWKVRSSHGSFIEKVYALDADGPNPVFPNIPDHEVATLRHLAGSGLAPTFESFDERRGDRPAVLRYRFVPGVAWQRGVADVAQLLSRVHASTPPPLRHTLGSGAEAVTAADAMVDDVPADLAVRLRRHRPEGLPGDGPPRRCLVHTDCGPGNLLRTRAGLILIDWQCPGIGDPVEDLSCFASPAIQHLYRCPPLSARLVERFLTAYDDPAAGLRYRRHGAGWHYRLAAYCAWRAHRLATEQPDTAARYREALDAELDHLERSW